MTDIHPVLTVDTYVDVHRRAEELGMGLIGQFSILPRHFSAAQSSTDLVHESSASTLRKLFSEVGLDVVQLQPDEGTLKTVLQKSADWVAPTIFVSNEILVNNPSLISLLLSILEAYIRNHVGGASHSRE